VSVMQAMQGLAPVGLTAVNPKAIGEASRKATGKVIGGDRPFLAAADKLALNHYSSITVKQPVIQPSPEEFV